MLRVVATINLFQGTPTSISAPAASNLSAEMQRGGKWWIETLRSVFWRVTHLRAECAALSFVSTGLTGGWVRPGSTGLTGEAYRSDRWC